MEIKKNPINTWKKLMQNKLKAQKKSKVFNLKYFEKLETRIKKIENLRPSKE